MTVEGLRARWRAGEHDAVLSALVERWRDSRAPVLAALIASLDPSGETDWGPDRKRRALALKRAWREPDVTAVSGRVRGLFRLSPEEARAVFRRRGEWLDDPRAVDALLEGVTHLPPGFASAAGLGFWSDVVTWLGQIPDPRIRPSLVSARDIHGARTPLGTLLDQRLPAAVPEPAEPRDAAQLQAWLGGTDAGPGTVEELIAAVYASPGDLDLRAVLGDLLAEAQDPRGTAIALELAGRSAASIHREHGRSWLGSIAPVVSRATFRLGFADHVVLRPEARLDPTAREWRTVRSVDLAGRIDADELFGSMPLLEEVHGAVELFGLPEGLRALSILNGTDHLESILQSDAWPDLRRLSVTPGPVGRMASVRHRGLATQLEELEIRSDEVALLAFTQDWDGAFSVTLTWPGTWTRTLRRDDHGRLSRLELVAPPGADATVLGSLRSVLAGLDTGRLTEVEVRLGARVEVSDTQRHIAGGLLGRLCPRAEWRLAHGPVARDSGRSVRDT